jgi:hypothetical protein
VNLYRGRPVIAGHAGPSLFAGLWTDGWNIIGDWQTPVLVACGHCGQAAYRQGMRLLASFSWGTKADQTEALKRYLGLTVCAEFRFPNLLECLNHLAAHLMEDPADELRYRIRLWQTGNHQRRKLLVPLDSRETENREVVLARLAALVAPDAESRLLMVEILGNQERYAPAAEVLRHVMESFGRQPPDRRWAACQEGLIGKSAPELEHFLWPDTHAD